MSCALPLIVFGQVYFLGSQSVGNAPCITSIPTLTSNIVQAVQPVQGPNQSEPVPEIRKPDYTYTPGIGAHKVHNQPTIWNNARKICISEGGHLAVINSVAESKVVAQLVKASSSMNYVYIGFHDLFQEGEFVAVDDQSLVSAGFNEWMPSEPNDGNGSEDCGSFHIDGKLNDIRCNAVMGFVCELPDVKEN